MDQITYFLQRPEGAYNNPRWPSPLTVTASTEALFEFSDGSLRYAFDGTFGTTQETGGIDVPQGSISGIRIYSGSRLAITISAEIADAYGLLSEVMLDRAYSNTSLVLLMARIGEGTGHYTGSDRTDFVEAGPGGDLIEGNDGHDQLSGGAGRDTILGGTGRDVLRGGLGADRIEGGIGGDVMHGGTGADTMLGGLGADRLQGGPGADLLRGGLGSDTLIGGAGNDLLRGGQGDDSLIATRGQDSLHGGAGDDTLFAADGVHVLDGGAGTDIFEIGLSGELHIDLASGDHFVFGDDLEVWLTDVEGMRLDRATGSLTGTAGAEYLGGGLGAVTLRGLGGDDSLDGGELRDLLEGGDGDDLLRGGVSVDTLLGGAGDDTLYGEDIPHRAWTNHGADYLDGGEGNDVLIGADTFADYGLYYEFCEYCANEQPGYADTLIGGAGDDTLWMSLRDEVWGGEGADVFTFLPGGSGRTYTEVTIHDFEQGIDVIDLSPNADMLESVAIDGSTAVLTFAGGRTWITLETNAALEQADFTGIGDLAFV
ncbi:calcium-binding protein [Poseidonocella sp. HB161398]|uniref:calcium-binding protein n=1 Tax=Poseidonocella sp. HB161398 TaxID=2320855 RepID=UPI001109186E|nr:calcium-binding protein [Poseidonocella sp. HB161398]